MNIRAALISVFVCVLPFCSVTAQYDIIPRPSSISIDAKGRVLTISDATPINDQLNADIKNAEGWRITVDKRGITVEASTQAGIFYAHQALRQIMDGATTSLPYAVVESNPRFAYRGMHLDICRHFFGKDVVKQYIDMMALHGMNTLHWHLSDDQGWRIEIKKWPRLTQVGAWRDRTVIGRNMGLYDHTMYGGFYTQKDIREIVEYAAQRHITIVPEIDMPGHMVAALAAYPELGCTGGPYEVWPDWGVSDDILCAGNPRVYEFLGDVLNELMELFPSSIIHLGGDEAPKGRWKQCPRCQQKMKEEHLENEEHLQGYMVRRMQQLLEKKGRRLMGWDEIMVCNVPKTSIVMNWRDWQGVVDPAKQGFDVVRTPNSTLYFDHYQIPADSWSNTLLIGGNSNLQKVYNYEPAPATLTAEEQAHVMGVQANLWTEYIAYPELIEYQVLPRMAALAEVQWAAPERKDYESFMSRLPRLLKIYQQEGWHYCEVKSEN
ncbi:MAG: beta-N-acetylhexosaminidase [Prevotella sp.]|nr:beta-N-acetylhexosaminidase [Prevotella sp.]